MGVRRYHKGAGGLHGNSGATPLETRLPCAAASSLKSPNCDNREGGVRQQLQRKDHTKRLKQSGMDCESLVYS